MNRTQTDTVVLRHFEGGGSEAALLLAFFHLPPLDATNFHTLDLQLQYEPAKRNMKLAPSQYVFMFSHSAMCHICQNVLFRVSIKYST